jgi:hypothetical protein
MTVDLQLEFTYQEVYAALVAAWRDKEYPWSYMHERGHSFGDRRCYMPDKLRMFMTPRNFPSDNMPCINALLCEGGGLLGRLAMLQWEGILQDVCGRLEVPLRVLRHAGCLV